MNTQQTCPVCEGAATLSTPTFSDPVTVVPMPLSVSCDEHGEFSVKEGFFPYVWDTILAEDKQTIGVYLKETKGRHDCVREIGLESWRHMASQGRKI